MSDFRTPYDASIRRESQLKLKSRLIKGTAYIGVFIVCGVGLKCSYDNARSNDFPDTTTAAPAFREDIKCQVNEQTGEVVGIQGSASLDEFKQVSFLPENSPNDEDAIIDGHCFVTPKGGNVFIVDAVRAAVNSTLG